MIFILPETKGISLERMDKLFGEVDFVEAGEREEQTTKAEAQAVHETEEKGMVSTHIEHS